MYPKEFQKETQISHDDYPLYKNSCQTMAEKYQKIFKIHKYQLWIVSYNSILFSVFNAHNYKIL